MPDRLYLSIWLRPNGADRLRQLERLLERFPFSKLAKRGPVLRVYAIEHAEPPLIEREFPLGTEPAVVLNAAREFAADDCCTLIDAFWDLWQLEVGESRDWKLGPAPVTLLCFGPEFENESGDHLRIDFGLDARFLPQKGADTRVVQENIRSLLHLVGDVDRVLAPDRRTLWSESGANFAEVLASTLTALDVN
ncbi:MAG TPA: hypothetical protein VGP79_14790 [Bryobacteraceae bacterium]|jgi:hypothetical protein|nr:hypothetical protein [Bryobacteraceae bacterium]